MATYSEDDVRLQGEIFKGNLFHYRETMVAHLYQFLTSIALSLFMQYLVLW
jgi:hypothetical protein